MVGLFSFGNDVYASSAKRKVFFSFHYDDIMRVNVVRLSGQFKTPEKPDGARSIEGFYDKSLWESRKADGPDALKTLIRTGVENTSVVCLLVGSQTFNRRWVRYEIARSVIDGKGLLAVHINSINSHKPPYSAHVLGPNPAYYMGLGLSENGNFYLCERKYKDSNWIWDWYRDYTLPVKVPKYMNSPRLGSPLRLSEVTQIYDWSNNGHRDIGGWLDRAAQDAGR